MYPIVWTLLSTKDRKICLWSYFFLPFIMAEHLHELWINQANKQLEWSQCKVGLTGHVVGVQISKQSNKRILRCAMCKVDLVIFDSEQWIQLLAPHFKISWIHSSIIKHLNKKKLKLLLPLTVVQFWLINI